MHRPLHPHRRITPAFIFTSLFGGVLITLFTAGPAPFLYGWLIDPSKDGRYQTRSINGPPAEFGPWAISRNVEPFTENWNLMYPGEYISRQSPTPLAADPPSWVHQADRQDFEARETPYVITTTGAGWPLPAFRYITWSAQRYPPGGPRFKSTRQYIDQIEHGWKLHTVIQKEYINDLIVPTSPIWPGLLADVAVWSLACACVMLSFTGLRSNLRRRRSLCPACAYCRKGLDAAVPCPECGCLVDHV